MNYSYLEWPCGARPTRHPERRVLWRLTMLKPPTCELYGETGGVYAMPFPNGPLVVSTPETKVVLGMVQRVFVIASFPHR